MGEPAAPARGGGRPPREAAEQIEGQIVDVARDLFFANGYGATSIEAIARKARISKRTFYARFANKAEIFRAVVNRLVVGISPSNVSSLFEGRSSEEILGGLASAILQASLAPQSLALQRLILAEAERFPELGIVMHEQGSRRDAIARIAALLERGTAAEELQVSNPDLAAEMFMQMIVALPRRRAMGLGLPMTEAELKEWSQAAVQLFLHGCAVRQA